MGCANSLKSHNPVISFAGFTGLSAVMGLMLTFILTSYTSSTIYTAFLTTGIIVVSMMLASMFFPAFFLSLGRVLLFALLGSIAVELIGGLIFHLPLAIMDYVVVVIFAGYIGYDWAKAQAYPKTLDNAIRHAYSVFFCDLAPNNKILCSMHKEEDYEAGWFLFCSKCGECCIEKHAYRFAELLCHLKEHHVLPP